MTKKTIYMRAVDALLLPNPPITQDQFKKWVKESGVEAARNKRVAVEVEA
jgi:uncharacterized protein YneF (UPF0154 family)